jgi:hypothetical protein
VRLSAALADLPLAAVEGENVAVAGGITDMKHALKLSFVVLHVVYGLAAQNY